MSLEVSIFRYLNNHSNILDFVMIELECGKSFNTCLSPCAWGQVSGCPGVGLQLDHHFNIEITGI